MLDAYGTRTGYGLAAAFWSIAGTLHAFAASAFQFGSLRMALGLSEAPNFPACSKAVAEYFPPSQKAFAMGVANFGTNLASIIGPGLFIWIASSRGWQSCFAIMGILGFVWVPVWLLSTPKIPKTLGLESAKIGFIEVLRYRPAWGYALAKFLTDPVWWFYLFWLPTYLTDVRGMTPGERATALTIIYAISGAGSLLGGSASSWLMQRGWPIGTARKTGMFVCAAMMPFSALGMVVENVQLAVLLFGLGPAAHQAWMANLFTTPADTFPKEAVASANGCGVFAGAMGGALFSGLIPGYLLEPLGYAPIVITLSCFYLLAWWLIHKLVGGFEMVKLRPAAILN